jgi:hypothetical protein
MGRLVEWEMGGGTIEAERRHTANTPRTPGEMEEEEIAKKRRRDGG